MQYDFLTVMEYQSFNAHEMLTRKSVTRVFTSCLSSKGVPRERFLFIFPRNNISNFIFNLIAYTLFIFNHFYRWAASSEFGTYRLCEQRRFRRACASTQSRQNLRCSLIQAVSQEEPSDRKPDPRPL